MSWRRRLLVLAVALAACAAPAAGGAVELALWHSQQAQNEQALKDIVARFNAAQPNYTLKLHNFGTYDALFEKTRLTIQGGKLPDLCVAYESMVAEFMEADAVLPLDDYLGHPDYGLSKEDQQDIFAPFLETNRFPDFGGQLLSFPFTKSVLMLYYNADLLRQAGHDKPPATWEQFLAHCRDIKAKTGKAAFAYRIDPSTFDSMVLSLGGKLLTDDRTATRFDSPQTLRVLQMLRTLIDEGLAKIIPVGEDDDRRHFAAGDVAMILRSSTTRAYMADDVVDEQGRDRFAWSMACPPVAKGQPRRTVLYGGNICVFKSTPERQRGAWEFIKFFVSPEATAEWSVRTGYLPVRRSAATQKALVDFFAEHPRNRAAFDVIPFAVHEPSVVGWQVVRGRIKQALNRVRLPDWTPEKIAAKLKEDADKDLQRRQQQTPGSDTPAAVWIILGAAVLGLLAVLLVRWRMARRASRP